MVEKHSPPLLRPETEETPCRSLGGEDPLEEGMATHSSTVAWRVPGTEEPAGCRQWGLRVGHDSASTVVTLKGEKKKV